MNPCWASAPNEHHGRASKILSYNRKLNKYEVTYMCETCLHKYIEFCKRNGIRGPVTVITRKEELSHG